MRKRNILTAILFLTLFAFASVNANAQGKERFTGTVVYYGSGLSTRTVTTNFTLDITGNTSDAQAKNYLSILKDKGQEQVLETIDDMELGRFSVGANVGVPVNVVRERDENDNRRIFVVFKRWTQFAELRYGYRSLDYPFGVIELFIDPRTGKGEGTYIAAAKVRWDSDGDGGAPQVEIENFATYPARLMGVSSDRKRP
jgi:hypothetical protein